MQWFVLAAYLGYQIGRVNLLIAFFVQVLLAGLTLGCALLAQALPSDSIAAGFKLSSVGFLRRLGFPVAPLLCLFVFVYGALPSFLDRAELASGSRATTARIESVDRRHVKYSYQVAGKTYEGSTKFAGDSDTSASYLTVYYAPSHPELSGLNSADEWIFPVFQLVFWLTHIFGLWLVFNAKLNIEQAFRPRQLAPQEA